MNTDSEQPVENGMKEKTAPATGIQPEYDRRGILLPARARVGGIITPQ